MRRHGFTLIELLVVIAIIAILAAILFPVFIRAKEAGRRASCGARMVQIDKALKLYANDYDHTMPPGGWAYDYSPGSGTVGWTGRIKRYLDRAAVPGEGVSGPAAVSKFYICPTTRFTWSYALNWRIVGAMEAGAWGPSPGSGYGEVGGDLSVIDNPDKVIELMEMNPVPHTIDTWDPLFRDADLTNDIQEDGQVTGASVWRIWLRLPGPHNGLANIVYLDGHLKAIRRWEAGRMTFRPINDAD